jgi:type I restriction enzyme S subunit
MYLWCKENMDDIKNEGNGSTFEEISKSSFKALGVCIPPKGRLKEFDEAVAPTFEKIRTNKKQIRTLEKLRDTLLPKLMSGEVRVAA